MRMNPRQAHMANNPAVQLLKRELETAKQDIEQIADTLEGLRKEQKQLHARADEFVENLRRRTHEKDAFAMILEDLLGLGRGELR